MIHTVLERTDVPIPATRDLREQPGRLAPAGIPFLISVGAAAYRHHRWLLPVRAGDELRVESDVLEVRPSASGPRQRVGQVTDDDAEPKRPYRAGFVAI